MAFLQSDGTSPVSSDFLKIIVRIGAISVTNSFSNFGFILSGPAALFGFMLVSNFRTPFSVISSSSAEGYWPDILQQVLNSSGLYVSKVEKADWNFYSGCLLGLLGESVVFHNYEGVQLHCFQISYI